MRTPLEAPPLDPSSAEARNWLVEELSKPAYRTEPTSVERFWDWLTRLLGGSEVASGPPAWVVPVVVLALLGVLALILVRTLRGSARAPGAGTGTVLEEKGVSAAAYRARAEQAGQRGDWDRALLDGFRAISAASVERTLVGDAPGRTAHEVALALAPVFPSYAGQLRSAADAFDAVRYGRRPARPEAARAVLGLDADLARSRPVLPEPIGNRG